MSGPCTVKVAAAAAAVAILLSCAYARVGRSPAASAPDRSGAPATTATPGQTDVDSDADVILLNPFDSTAADVARVRAQQDRPVWCQVSAGVWEPTLPDAQRFDPAVIGAPLPHGSSRWLDLRRWDLLADVLTDRVALCAAKGFDGIGVEGLDGYAYATGFDLAADDAVDVVERLVAVAGRFGLAVRILDPAVRSAGVAAEAGSADTSTTTGS